MTNHSYLPPLDDPEMISIARHRGLLGKDESLRQGHRRVADALGAVDRELGGDTNFTETLHEALISGQLGVSSQIFAAAGRSGHAAACTVLPTVGATDESRLERLIAETVAASTRGMGCGADLTDFDDPVAALHAINETVRILGEQLAERDLRPPALMVSCRADHPDIESFIRAKWDADFSKWVANISVRLTGCDLEWRRLRPLLAAAAHRNGEPGILFQDIADADNPTPQLPVTSTAPCAEVFLAPGERCVFMSVNAAAHTHEGRFDWQRFGETVRLAVRAADAAVQLAASNGPPIVTARRRIGVGVCGFHSALIALGVPYASDTGIDFASRIAEHLTYNAHQASADLATERGPFPLFAESRWTDPAWLRRKADRRSGAIDPVRWERLTDQITSGGIRHSAVVAYPPTGVVALLLGVSRSYEPHFSLAGRTGVASQFDQRLAPEVSAALARLPDGARVAAAIAKQSADDQVPGADHDHLLACARQIPVDFHLAVHAAFSGLADESGSKTINMPASTTLGEVEGLLDTARRQGVKGLTVFRDGCLTDTKETAA